MSCRSSSHSNIVVAVVIAVEVQGKLYSLFQVHDRLKKKKYNVLAVHIVQKIRGNCTTHIKTLKITKPGFSWYKRGFPTTMPSTEQIMPTFQSQGPL